MFTFYVELPGIPVRFKFESKTTSTASVRYQARKLWGWKKLPDGTRVFKA